MKKLFVYLLCVTVFCQYSCGSNAVAGSQESQEKLANGMTIETYKIKETIDLKNRNSLCDKSEFDYEIDWPIDGPQPLLNKCRKWILQQLKGNENPANGELSSGSLSLAIEERIKNNSTSYDRYDEFDGTVDDRIEIKIKADDAKTCLTSHIEELRCGGQRYNNYDATCNLLNSGEEMTYSIFPPIENMRPYLWKYMKCFGEPCEVWEYPELAGVQYPKNLPVITENGFDFVWGRTELPGAGSFSSEVPFSDIIRLINKEGLNFIPQAAIEDFKKNSNGDLNKETLLLYGKAGVANDKNDHISHEFSDLLRLIHMVPTDNPGGISDYDEITWHWLYDDCEETGFTGAEIISKNENTAKGILIYKCGERRFRHNVDLVKEKFVYPSGLEELRWVVDDFDNKKAKLLATINEAGTEFSNGLGQRLMNSPEDSGFMSEKEKREYLQQVDEFLKAYNKFKSKH